jgi:CBS domain-containing protein
MNPGVLTVPEDMSVRELASFLLGNQISGAPVVGTDGDLVGVVSMTDIVAAGSGDLGLTTDRRHPSFYLRDLEETYSDEDVRSFHVEEPDRSVREIMTNTVYSVEVDATVAEVARVMLDGHLHRVLVTQDREVVGIISTSDVLGLLVEEDRLRLNS